MLGGGKKTKKTSQFFVSLFSLCTNPRSFTPLLLLLTSLSWTCESSCLVILINGLSCLTTVPLLRKLCEVPATRFSCAGRVSILLALTCGSCARRGSGAISHPPLPAPCAEGFLCCCGSCPGSLLETARMWRHSGKELDHGLILQQCPGMRVPEALGGEVLGCRCDVMLCSGPLCQLKALRWDEDHVSGLIPETDQCCSLKLARTVTLNGAAQVGVALCKTKQSETEKWLN